MKMNNKGFTLVELFICLAIVTIASLTILPAIYGIYIASCASIIFALICIFVPCAQVLLPIIGWYKIITGANLAVMIVEATNKFFAK